MIREYMDNDYLVRENPGGAVERILISPEPEPSPRPRIVITQIVCDDPDAVVDLDAGDVTCAAGAIVAATAELRMPDGSPLPLSAAFRMPLVARDGRERILRAQFVGGVAEIAATLPDSGCWRVTESTINQDLPEEHRMEFAGLTVFVVQ